MSIWQNLRDGISTMAGRKPKEGPTITNTYPVWETQTPSYPVPQPYQLAQLGYRRNELVFACIDKRATIISEPRLCVYDSPDKKKRKAIDNHPAVKLIQNPNEAMSAVEFWRAVQIYIDIAGFSAWEFEFNRMGEPIALWPMRPDWCAFKRGINRPLAFITYRPPGLPEVDVPIERCLLFQEFDPLYPMLRGLSRTAVALRVTSVDNSATDFLKLFFENGSVVNGLLTTEQSLSEPEAKQYRQSWREAHGGFRNWVDAAILGKGLKYQQTQMNFKDMAFGEIDGRDEARTCMVFNMPPIILGAKVGLASSTYSNYEQAVKALYNDFAFPSWRWYESELSNQLLPHYTGEAESELYCEFELGEIRALSENEESIWKRANDAATRNIITRDEARAKMGYDPIDNSEVFVGTQPPMVGEEMTPEAEVERSKERAETFGLPVNGNGNQTHTPVPKFGDSNSTEDEMPDEARMKLWRQMALDSPGRGVGSPFDDELNGLHSKQQVRMIFSKHWPKPKDPALVLAEEIRLARMAIERV